jgi:DNA-binding response OmpR family regulator
MNTLINVSGDQVGVLPSSPQANAPPLILVVEDESDIRRLSVGALVRSGYQMHAAEDGAAAREALHDYNYDLLITDSNMPKVSGVELLKKLRAARMSPPVIMATGAFPSEEFNRYPWLQPAATLLKPHAIAELLSTVKEILHATDGAREQNAPVPNWQSQPSAVGLRL